MRQWFSVVMAWALVVSTTTASDLVEISVVSSKDGTSQPSLLYVPEKIDEPVPLLVLLHTWSGDWKQKNHIDTCLEESKERGWALLHPNFRGPNWTPEACGSDLAVQDIIDTIDHVIARHSIDEKRVYLAGTSGGGHMSMLMAGRHPGRWAGVSAWVGISDLAAWHAETKAAGRNYYTHLEKAIGGPPDVSTEVRDQYEWRSPLTWLHRAKGLPIDLNTGIHDGHTGSVPVSHSLRAFNKLAAVNGHGKQTLTDAQIQFMASKEKVPDYLAFDGESEEREHEVLFRRNAGPVRVTIFEGGHEGDLPTAIRWLAQQSR